MSQNGPPPVRPDTGWSAFTHPPLHDDSSRYDVPGGQAVLLNEMVELLTALPDPTLVNSAEQAF